MFRIKKFALAAVALSALSLSVTGCFGDDSTDNPLTSTPAADTMVTKTTIKVGDFNASAGSFIALGTPAAYKTAELPASASTIDLVFCARNTDDALVLESTADAVKNKDVGTTTASATYWGAGKGTIIVPVTGTLPTTVAKAKAAVGTATTQSVALTEAGGSYVVALTDGSYAVLTVSAPAGVDVTTGVVTVTAYSATIAVLKK